MFVPIFANSLSSFLHLHLQLPVEEDYDFSDVDLDDTLDKIEL